MSRSIYWGPSKTLTAGQLIAQLSKLPPDTPVVMEQRDEPDGEYGVRNVEAVEMHRDGGLAKNPWGVDVWHEPQWLTGSGKDYDPPQQVAWLRREAAWQPTIDAEIEPLALPAAVTGGEQK